MINSLKYYRCILTVTTNYGIYGEKKICYSTSVNTCGPILVSFYLFIYYYKNIVLLVDYKRVKFQ